MSAVTEAPAPGSGDAADERTRLAPAGWYRHPADVARLVVALAVTVLIGLVVEVYPQGVLRASTDLVRLVSNLPGWLTSFVVGFLQLAALLTPIVVVGILVLRRKWAVLGLLALAAALAAALAFLGHVFVDDTAPVAVEANEKLDSWFTERSFPSGTYLAMAAALATAAGPFLHRSWRRTVWVGVGAAAVLRMLTAAEVPINLATGLAIGCLAGSLALVLLGAPPQRIDTDLVRSVLERCGLQARSITSLSRDRGSGGRNATPTSSSARGGPCGSRASATTGPREQHDELRRTQHWPRASLVQPVRASPPCSAWPRRTSRVRCC
jgi:undecaprenyl-diphosphatase